MPKPNSTKVTRSKESNENEPGLLSKLANLVGLGDDGGKTKSVSRRKTAPEKKAGSKSSSTAGKGNKGTASKKSGSTSIGSPRATANKRTPSKSGSKSASSGRSTARSSAALKKKSGAASNTKAGKKAGARK